MVYFDLPIEELRRYKPPRNEPADFLDFWQETLESARAKAAEPQFQAYDSHLVTVDVFDVTFSGFDGQEIKAWFLLPRSREEPLPVVIEFMGYSLGRSFPIDWLLWSSAGYAHLLVDTRGQGYDSKHGDTPDVETIPSNGQVPGFMTRGILNPETYYYRRVFTDAVLAIDALKTCSEIDPQQIAVVGKSQGGGISLAAAGLSTDVKVVMPDVPFLCHFPRAMEITDEYPYQELVQYCKTRRHQTPQVLKTLSYFDGVNFAAHAQANAYFSVGLMDQVCPPSTVFAAYNHYPGDKQIEVYAYNEHEGGESHHKMAQLEYLKTAFDE